MTHAEKVPDTATSVRKPDIGSNAFWGSNAEEWCNVLATFSHAFNRKLAGDIRFEDLERPELESGEEAERAFLVVEAKLAGAADAAFLAVQGYLGPRVGSQLPISEFAAIWDTTIWARRAMRYQLESDTKVKQRESELLRGSDPLAFCVGTSRMLREGRRTWAPGCGRVFIDISHAPGGRVRWQRWCSKHQNVDSARMLPQHVRRSSS